MSLEYLMSYVQTEIDDCDEAVALNINSSVKIEPEDLKEIKEESAKLKAGMKELRKILRGV